MVKWSDFSVFPSLHIFALSQFLQWKLRFKGAWGAPRGLGAGGEADPYMFSTSCHLQRQQWRWIDGATYLYRTWSGKSVGGNKHCAEMSAYNSKFKRQCPPPSGISVSYPLKAKMNIAPSPSISHKQLLFSTGQWPCHKRAPTFCPWWPFTTFIINVPAVQFFT